LRIGIAGTDLFGWQAPHNAANEYRTSTGKCGQICDELGLLGN